MTEEILCPNCLSQFFLADNSIKKLTATYCPFCRHDLFRDKTSTTSFESNKDTYLTSAPHVSFIEEHLPKMQEILFAIGPYQIIQSIGKGGMGEVFLAYDTTCGRRIALKKIRSDLIEHKQLHNRFLKEARITSQLTHPSIIPIYAIHKEPHVTYYTMPFVEGKTLKILLRTAKQQERKGAKMDHLTESIPALTRLFLSICQAIAYAHSKNVLHRDLKPENIIIGQYGQIVILDWGLAKLLKQKNTLEETLEESDFEDEKTSLSHVTHIGKVVGTVSYMAPERAFGNPANFQTDIYSLGVILYQLLTLKHPFYRESLKEFKKNADKERLIDPIELSPYRDIPSSLSLIVMKCLSKDVHYRYAAVDHLIHDLENYIEGRSEWFEMTQLDLNKKTDWEFQENVFIAQHVVLTRGKEDSHWVSLNVSKNSFQETIKIELKVKIEENGEGIGILLAVPEASERKQINDGYCLWLGTDKNKTTKLLRSSVEVMQTPEVFLKENEWVDVKIEKIENNLHIYLNNNLEFSYITHIPISGTHVGILLKDEHFLLDHFSVFIGSHNVNVNCLAVPDAFLAHNNFATALSEYRRIGYSFPGRAEGREAMFRAGITLLEEANRSLDEIKKADLYNLAHEEFHKLYNTPGAPLEYLGKALIYQALKEDEEEAKCFELAYRRYPKHPLLPILEEQIVYRMHESSRYNRKATFNFMLVIVKFLPKVSAKSSTLKLQQNLERHWEILPFIERDISSPISQRIENFSFGIKLAFWLAKPYALSDIIHDILKVNAYQPILMGNALFCMIELGAKEIAKEIKQEILQHSLYSQSEEFETSIALIDILLKIHDESIESAFNLLLQSKRHFPSLQLDRVIIYFLEYALDRQNLTTFHRIILEIEQWPLLTETHQKIDNLKIFGSLLEKKWTTAGELLNSYSVEELSQETSILHFLYGCWLNATEGKEIASIYFSGILEVPYPKTWGLLAQYLKNNEAENKKWITTSFLWERRHLFRQIALFSHCEGHEKMCDDFFNKSLKEVYE